MKTFYLNGQVFTGQLPLMQAFCVEDGRFLAVGTNEALSAQIQPQDRIVSLEGHFVCPGFVDSHMHLLNYGATLTQCDLTCCTNSLSALQKGLKDYIDRQQIPDGTWVRGRGWNQDYFAPASGIPTREDLDAVSTRHPICIVRCCGHCLVVNTKALELLQLDASLAQPEGGSFDLDNRGQMTGVFRDTAMSLIYTRLPAPNREEIKQMIRSAQKQFNTCGVTSCHSDDLCAFENVSWQEVIQAYQELEQAGELTIRVYEQSQFTSPQTLQTFFDAGYTTGTGSSLFRIGPLKMLGDGSLGARTAYLAGTYADAPGERGLAIFTQEEFDAMITLARKYRMQVAIHAIGDGILDRILLAYEKAFRQYPDNDHRCGIVHVQLTRPEQLEAMRTLNLHAYIQSIFLDYDSRIVRERAGTALAQTSYAFHSMKCMGLHVSNGTDCPVEYPHPMRGIQCAITRQPLDGSLPPYRPEEAMTLEEALVSYSAEGAYASFEENTKGKIQPDHLADFVILSQNPFTVSPTQLSSITPLATFLAGKCVYQNGK